MRWRGALRSQSFSPPRGRRKTHLLVRTSTIFSANVHDPKGCRKTSYKKNICVDLLSPNILDSVKRHLSRRHLSVLSFLFNLILDGGCTPEKRNPLSLKRHLFLNGDRVKMLAQGFLDLFFDTAPHLEYFSDFSSSALKRHLLKRHLTLSE